jgi:hypothetical protein
LDIIQILPIENPPSPPDNSYIIGLAYKFGPDEATFNPPITITILYDPNSLVNGVSEKSLYIANVDTETGEWVKLQGVVDPETHAITAQVTRFAVLAIIGEAAPKSLSTPGISWSLTGGIVTGFILLTLLAYAFAQGRGRGWYWNGADWIPPGRKSSRDWYWNGTDWVPPGK